VARGSQAQPHRELERIEAASLDDLMQAHPALWREVGQGLVEASERRSPEALAAFVERALAAAAPWRERVRKSHGNPEVLEQALPKVIAARMAKLAVERTLLAAATGVASGGVRMGRVSGSIANALLFRPGSLERKPVSMAAFRLLWPLVSDRRLLMPLVQPRGIWCFYSRALVKALAALAAGRPVLELAAGDGTLARFLAAEGVAVTATDDQSWKGAPFPASVEKLDAVSALARHPAPVVLCSFPPPGNRFERRVFQAAHVDTYVVVTSRHRHAAGDWDAYEQQEAFERTVDARLSRLVLPPELDPAVLVFRRKG
jgi:hypothetical protein